MKCAFLRRKTTIFMLFLGLLGQSTTPLFGMLRQATSRLAPGLARVAGQQSGRRVAGIAIKVEKQVVKPLTEVATEEIAGAGKRLVSTKPLVAGSVLEPVAKQAFKTAEQEVAQSQTTSSKSLLTKGLELFGIGVKRTPEVVPTSVQSASRTLLSDLRKVPCKNPELLPKVIDIQEPLACVSLCEGTPNCPKSVIDLAYVRSAHNPESVRAQSIKNEIETLNKVAREVKDGHFAQLSEDVSLWTKEQQQKFAQKDYEELIRRNILAKDSEGLSFVEGQGSQEQILAEQARLAQEAERARLAKLAQEEAERIRLAELEKARLADEARLAEAKKLEEARKLEQARLAKLTQEAKAQKTPEKVFYSEDPYRQAMPSEHPQVAMPNQAVDPLAGAGRTAMNILNVGTLGFGIGEYIAQAEREKAQEIERKKKAEEAKRGWGTTIKVGAIAAAATAGGVAAAYYLGKPDQTQGFVQALERFFDTAVKTGGSR